MKERVILPVLKKRPSEKRGRAGLSWLDSRHSFSFGNYMDPRNMGFRCLRVINEDTVATGKAYGNHAHDNMQILTYVISGSLQQTEAAGNCVVLNAGDFQCITAGSGITHNESNPSRLESTHLIQFWFYPNQQNLKPNEMHCRFEFNSAVEPLHRIGSIDGRDHTLCLEQDIHLYLGRFAADQTSDFEINPGRHAWVQVIDGDLQITPIAGLAEPHHQGIPLSTGDGLAISDLTQAKIQATRPSEILLFDLA